MALITPGTKLAHIINTDPNIITVLNRFNIRLGVGDKTVESICQELHIDEAFLLTVINTFLFDDYIPHKALSKNDAAEIVKYLKHTNAYTLQYKLPNIERHFKLLLGTPNQKNNLQLILKFFLDLKGELIKSIEVDNSVIFPKILAETVDKNYLPDLRNNSDDQDNSVEQKFVDLKNMIILHTQGEYDENLCNAVLFAVLSLEKDIKQNNRIKAKMLMPYIETLV